MTADRDLWTVKFILGVEPRRGGRTLIPWFELDVLGADQDHELGQEGPGPGSQSHPRRGLGRPSDLVHR